VTAPVVLRPAAFLDRDGVLNDVHVIDGRPHPPDGIADLRLLPGVAEACHALAAAGLVLVVVTNQPDVARGTRTRGEIDAVNRWLAERLPLDAVRVCPHDDADGCHCRKPLPGLLLDAAADLGLALDRSVMVGDRWRDVDAGHAAGCRTVFIDRAYDEALRNPPDLVVSDLLGAVPWILDHARGRLEP
jgi:D-glycero-D-manno-heptose 1,7-bisphosphate phosphatase